MSIETSPLKQASLVAPSGEAILVRFDIWEGKFFIECDNADQFLTSVLGVPAANIHNSLNPFIRGVVIPGEGGYFDLMCKDGVVKSEIAHLSSSEAQEIIVDAVLVNSNYQ